MQLNITTDYALRLVYYLASVRRPAGSAEISGAMHITQSALGPIAQALKKGGILKTRRGASGGYFLAKTPDNISLGEIINLMEGTTRINRCMEPDGYCNRRGVPDCPFHRFYAQVQFCLDEAFQKKTIASML